MTEDVRPDPPLPPPDAPPWSSASGPPGDSPAERPAGPDPLPLPVVNGSTGSHRHVSTPSETGAAPRTSVESDIAQFLAHPNGAAPNTDDAPTVITKGRAANAAQTPPPPPVVLTNDPPSLAGRRLGHFELIEAVGAGGMAAVLRARDTELGRVVALKILPPDAARDPESVNRFKQEARAAAALDHDNIARVYFCGEDQGLHFIAFEFVEGDTLRQLIDRRKVLPASVCVRYMVQVAAGLNHAAERGVVHRDIKPSNIIITPDGRAKIVDMGLARHLGSEGVNGGVTQSGVTLGTFDYISPEQALDPRRADVRSDIYSLGCTFYHALAGRPPVPEGTAARKLRAHQTEPPLDPRELNPAVPDELVAVLARMMAKDPARRYQTPLELIAHLKGLIERFRLGADVLGSDSAAKAVPAERHLLPEPPRFPPWWVLATIMVAFAVVAVVVANSHPVASTPYAQPKPPRPADPPAPPPAKPPDADGPPAPRPAGPVTTAEELAQRLRDPATKRVVLGPGPFDLTALDRPVLFKGAALELVGAAGGTRVKLCAGTTAATSGTLTIRAQALTVRDVWFEAALDPDVTLEADGVTQPVGLRVEDAAKVELIDCVFAAPDAALKDHEPRAIDVTARAGGAVRIDAVRCLFAPGFVGAAVPAGAQVALSDCGFAPHSAGVLVKPGAEAADPTGVRLEHSSFMLDPGTCAVEAGAPVNVRVTASGCLFAPVGGPPARPFAASDANRRGVLVRVRGDRPDGVQLVVPPGQTNGYYNVDPVGTAQKTLSFDDCKELAAQDRDTIRDDGRAQLAQRPWAEPRAYDAVSAAKDPWRAFRLRVAEPDADAALFTAGKPPVPLGVWFHSPADNVRRAYPGAVWPPPRPASAVAAKPKTRVWCPDARAEDLRPGEFAELKSLLKTARSGDEILVRTAQPGEYRVEGEEIKTALRPGDDKMQLTFKPWPGSRPVLVARGDNELKQPLFTLKTGEVTFEGFEFRLKPNRPRDGQTIAAVDMIGGKGVTFRDCTFTLAEEDDSRTAVVHLPDIDKVMAMDPANRPVPQVRFDHCLIRGKGRAVWVDVSRPFALDVTGSLVALDGPVICTEAGGKPAGAPGSSARLTRTTVLVGGPVVEMHGSKATDPKGAGLVKLGVEADECLFVAVPGAGRPLVEVEGVDPADVMSVFAWRVSKGNRYANFEPAAVMALIRPGGDGAAKEWTRDDWIGNVGEPVGADKRFHAVTFATPVTALKDLAAVRPADVAVKSSDATDLIDAKALGVGADPAALPPARAEPKPE